MHIQASAHLHRPQGPTAMAPCVLARQLRDVVAQKRHGGFDLKLDVTGLCLC